MSPCQGKGESVKSVEAPFVSILVVTHNRLGLLEKMITSVLREIGDLSFELLVVINGSDEGTESALARKFLNHPSLKVLSIEKVTPGAARNAGIRELNGKYICFLDDDLEVPPGYFRVAEETLLHKSQVDVFGGPDRTPPQSSRFSNCVGVVLTSRLATWQTRFRHASLGEKNSNASETQLILCNMWAKRTLFSQDGFQFEPDLIRNEENYLLFNLKKAQKSIVYIPSLYVFHHRRPNLEGVARQSFRAGYSRMKSFFMAPDSFELVYSMPSFFVLYLLLLPLSPHFVAAAPLALYVLLCTCQCLRLGLLHQMMRSFFTLFSIHVAINICYGMGFAFCVLEHLRNFVQNRFATRMET
jgi:succinoglycan biosynthesis protein ExoA